MSTLKLKKKNDSSFDEDSLKESAGDNENGINNINQYFYKVSNHHELFKIGRSFYEDYKTKGVKSFAISSTGYQDSQQKSILGLASFFDHKTKIKIGIISDNLFDGTFKDLLMASELEDVIIGEKIPALKIYSFYDHFEFLDLKQVVDLVNDHSIAYYDEVLDKLIENYDIIFWDVPELQKIQKNSEKFFPIIMKFESLSIIVSQRSSSAKDIEEIKNFFLGYGINLKGLLLESVKENDDDQAIESERPWWRFF